MGAFAQSVSFSVSPEQVEVGEGESFELSYTLTNVGMKDFQAPSFANFDLVGGPNRSTSMQFANGRMSSNTGISYYLSPKKAGQYTIPAATIVTDNGQTLRSGKVSVKVSKGSSGSNRRRRPTPSFQQPNFPFGSPPFGGQPQMPQTPTNTQTDNIDVFLRVVTDTPQVYKGQQLTAFYRIYTNVDITDYNIITPPSFVGFWVEEMDKQNSRRGHEEKVNGKTYTAYDLKQYALFPQQTGQLHLDPIKMNVTVQIPDTRFGGIFSQHHSFELKSDSAVVKVNELPTDKQPADFSGAVGRLQLSASLPQGNAKTGEPLILEVVVSGESNIKLLEQPILTLPPDFEKYDPKINEEIFSEANKIKGRRIFEYTLIPNKTGNYTLPPITYTYFDLETQHYKTLNTPSFSINVEQGNNQYVASQTSNNDLRNIDPPTADNLAPKKSRQFFGSALYIVLWLLPLAALSLAYRQQQKKRREQIADAANLRSMKAGQTARKRLQTAQNLLTANDKKPFYDEVVRVLHYYLADKFGLTTNTLNEETIKTTLLQNSIATDTIRQLLATLQHCQMALYAPINPQSATTEQTYQQTEALLAAIDNQLEQNKAARLRQKKAMPELQSQLQKAQDLLESNEFRPFYDELIRTIWSYLNDRFGIVPTDMKNENIAHVLTINGASTSTISEFISLLQRCEHALFAPSVTHTALEAQTILADTREVLQQVDTETNKM